MAGNHSLGDLELVVDTYSEVGDITKPGFTYEFHNFFHPFVGDLISKLNKESLQGFLDPEFHNDLIDETFFDNLYKLLPSDSFDIKHHPKEIDVSVGGPYANYNWEMFFHAPLLIATHLSKNQRFAEAQRWFHYIFDPTCNDASVPTPTRFWKFLAFRYGADTTPIDEQLFLLSMPDEEITDSKQK